MREPTDTILSTTQTLFNTHFSGGANRVATISTDFNDDGIQDYIHDTETPDSTGAPCL
ncbi:hypothetical protein L1D15_14895 [Vibrio sp. Isolate25]|uniref:hypothetical protein n=1 Tax=Vibrio sp. Isolate25 TaxID=2908535 RepID=UPI001EFE31D2|nr:hypothetical protein [Vibrio sp. Isolate25]MCG9598006.1 hypothetical protein [Vibrio sp. Isolate25]